MLHLISFPTAFLGWDYIEPIVGLISLFLVAKVYLATKIKKLKKTKSTDGKIAIIVQVGRPVLDAVKRFLKGQNIKKYELADIEAVLGKKTLENELDYKKFVQFIYRLFEKNQGSEILVFLSGPVALNFQLGNLIGLHHFDVRIFQFNPPTKGYIELPAPGRDWM